jgi:hypothetical protein
MRATTSRMRRIAAVICTAPIFAIAAGAGAASAAVFPPSSHVASDYSKSLGDRLSYGDGWGWGWGDGDGWGWGDGGGWG